MPEIVEISGGSLGRRLTSRQRKRLPSREFGLPRQRKYPMENRTHAIDAKARATEEFNRGRLTKTQWERITKKANRVMKRYGKKGMRGLADGLPGLIELTPKTFRDARLEDATIMLRGAMAYLGEGDAEMAADLCIAGAIEATMAFKEDRHLANRLINTARGILRMAIRAVEYNERPADAFALVDNSGVYGTTGKALGKSKRRKAPKKRTKKRKVSRKTLLALKRGREKRLANLRKNKKSVKRTVKRTGRKVKRRVTRKRRS